MHDTLQKLKAIAEKASPAPWVVKGDNVVSDVGLFINMPQGENTRKLIAAMNPSTVIALLELVEYYQKEQFNKLPIESKIIRHIMPQEQELLQRIKEGAGL